MNGINMDKVAVWDKERQAEYAGII